MPKKVSGIYIDPQSAKKIKGMTNIKSEQLLTDDDMTTILDLYKNKNKSIKQIAKETNKAEGTIRHFLFGTIEN